MPVQYTEQDVRRRAYELWESRGRPDGSSDDDWIAAEEALRLEAQREAGESSLEPLAADAAEALEPGVLDTEGAPISSRNRKPRGDAARAQT